MKPNAQTAQPFQAFLIYTKEREIMRVKFRRNIRFLKARKIIESYMKYNTYAYVEGKSNHQ